MNFLKKWWLKKQRDDLLRKWDYLERLQVDHSHDELFFKYLQRRMDSVDEQLEHIRWVLNGRCDE